MTSSSASLAPSINSMRALILSASFVAPGENLEVVMNTPPVALLSQQCASPAG